MNGAQTVHERSCAHGTRGEFVGDEFLAARDGVGDAQKHFAIPEKRELQQRAFAQRSQRAADGIAGFVNPRAEFGVAAVVMAEFVSEHGAELRAGERAHQREAQPHDAPAAEAHDAATLGDPGIQVWHKINFDRHGLPGAPRHGFQFVEQLRMLVPGQRRTGSGEFVEARHDGPENGKAAQNANQRELDADAMRINDLRVRDVKQAGRNRQREQIKPDHQNDGHQRAPEDGRIGRHKSFLVVLVGCVRCGAFEKSFGFCDLAGCPERRAENIRR